jgi:hypothetical protein
MSDYATLDQITARLLPNSKIAADDPMLAILITSASRAVDSYLTVEDDFFAEAGPDATPRDVYGNGGLQIKLPPYVGDVTEADVVAPPGYTTPTFDQVSGWLCITNRALAGMPGGQLCNCPDSPFLWRANVPYTVSARWGWPAIPADINEAVIETVVRWYRGRDDAYVGVIAMESVVAFERALPVGAKTILDIWRVKLVRFGFFKD